MEKVDDSFYDNSSGALDIGYSATSVRISSASPDDRAIASTLTHQELADREKAAERYQEIVAPIAQAELAAASGPKGERLPDGTLIATNSGAYASFTRRISDLQQQGYETAEATRIAREEMVAVSNGEAEPKRDYLGDSVENLMSRKVKGGGGGGGSKAKQKIFPERCIYKDCTLQLCDHPKRQKKKRGRPKSANPKTVRYRSRMTQDAAAGFKKAGVKPVDVIELVGTALLHGRSYEEVRVALMPASVPAA